MKFYHATSLENMQKIIDDGKIKHSFGGEVFLCRKPLDVCKFLVLRGLRNVYVIEVELKETDVQESYDHAESFFRCKAYVHNGDIQLSRTEAVTRYEFDF